MGHFGQRVYNSSGHLVSAKIHKSTWITKNDLGKIAKSRKLFEFAFENIDSATSEYENDLLKVLSAYDDKLKKVQGDISGWWKPPVDIDLNFAF